MGSRKYLLRKVLHALATLAFVLAFNFVLFRAIGDPVKLLTRSERAPRSCRAGALREEFGIDDPLPATVRELPRRLAAGRVRVLLHLGPAGDGPSHPRTVWPTVLLVGTATILSTVFGILIGIKGAWRRGSAFDTGSLLGSLTLYSMPEGWLGMILLITFAGTLGWFPAGGYESTDRAHRVRARPGRREASLPSVSHADARLHRRVRDHHALLAPRGHGRGLRPDGAREGRPRQGRAAAARGAERSAADVHTRLLQHRVHPGRGGDRRRGLLLAWSRPARRTPRSKAATTP